MKKYYFIILVALQTNLIFSQSQLDQKLCDKNVCPIPITTMFRSSTKGVMVEKSIKEEKKIKEEETKTGILIIDDDYICKNPNFRVYLRDGTLGIDNAERIGMTNEITNKQQKCNLASPRWAFIKYDAKKLTKNTNEIHCVVNSFDSRPVFMDECFLFLLTNPDYWCYGLPLFPTEYVYCKTCKKYYKKQIFKNKEGVETIFYNDASGTCSEGKNHDGLVLEEIKGCPKRIGEINKIGGL